ncbi:hypothetical protein AAY473_008144 [Plecturocebus cupreus]
MQEAQVGVITVFLISSLYTLRRDHTPTANPELGTFSQAITCQNHIALELEGTSAVIAPFLFLTHTPWPLTFTTSSQIPVLPRQNLPKPFPDQIFPSLLH